MRRVALSVLVAGAVVLLTTVKTEREGRKPLGVSSASPGRTPPGDSCQEPAEGATRALRLPSGAPAALDCENARRVVTQARMYLAAPPTAVDANAFGEAVIDWLDPHGLWSAAPDARVAPLIRKRARELLHEIEMAPTNRASCAVASELGEQLRSWVAELRGIYLGAQKTAPGVSRDEAFRLVSLPLFEDGPVLRPARELASSLGRSVGAVHRVFGESLDGVASAVLTRTLPDTGVAWSDVILAAAVRSYVPQIDPHGGWAPFDEETSLYEVDLEASPPPRLWRRMVRTPVGLRVEETTAQGLEAGDVVVSVDDVPTACLSVEQAEQLALVDNESSSTTVKSLWVLGPHDASPRHLEITMPQEASLTGEALSGLDSRRIHYGKASVLVISINDVPDNLGDELSATLTRARLEGRFSGVLLDMRGNGGGSTDGANTALGLFLPGAKLFPLRRRDGTIEVERAPSPPVMDRWPGPVATLVDGDTASAAEMIAGALAAYHRGPVIGGKTYGKGCAQEYLDDDAQAGVLRLTTLVYALPDGSPVQRTGIGPALTLGLPRSKEREGLLSHALPAWQGPDVRDETLVREVPWPGHGGSVGPCTDDVICKALRLLGSRRAPMARGGRP